MAGGDEIRNFSTRKNLGSENMPAQHYKCC